MSAAADRSPNLSRPAPRDYDELFREWAPYVRRVAVYSGIPDQDADDFVTEVMLYFLERDSLSYYDPAVAPFSTFLRAYVVRRGYSYRRSLRRLRPELALSPDAPVGGEDEDLVRGDLMAAPTPRYANWIVSRSEMTQFHAFLLERGDELLASLFARVMLESSTQNEVVRWRLAQFLDITESHVDTLMLELRALADQADLLRP